MAIGKCGKGSVRDALSLTDQAIAFGGGQIQTDTVLSMLGLVNRTDIALRLLRQFTTMIEW